MKVLSTRRRELSAFVWFGYMVLLFFIPNRPYFFFWAPQPVVLTAAGITIIFSLYIYYVTPKSIKILKYSLLTLILSALYVILYGISSVILHFWASDFWLGLRQGWPLLLLLIIFIEIKESYTSKREALLAETKCQRQSEKQNDSASPSPDL